MDVERSELKVGRWFPDYAAVQDYLFSLKARGIKFGIDRMRMMVEALGHPERAVPTIHLSGTNGKGSTSAMLDAILHAAGWRTGLYTSPHLVRLGERVQVNRALLTEAELAAFTRELRPIAEEISRDHPDDHPSFFEFMTAMAFLQFQRQHCDVGIIEVGMGGRLDATNVVLPEVAAITSISLDHCEMLGDSVEKIATEKAGIIKAGRPVVIGRLPAGAEQVIRQIAAGRDARVWSVREEFGDDIARYPTTNLECDYQRWNAATATLVARALGERWRLTDEVVRRGLQQVYWPGRWQRGTVGGRPIIYDASHNPEGAEVLDVNLCHLVAETGRAPVVIVGALGVARAQPLIETVCRYASGVYFVVPHQARACNYEQLEALVPAGYRGHVCRATVEELFPSSEQCTAGDAGDLIVVTGSIYLLGEVLARVEPARGAGEGKLQDF